MCVICQRVLQLNYYSGEKVECDKCHVKPYLVWLEGGGIRWCPKCLRKHIADIYPTDFIHAGKILKLHRELEINLVDQEGQKYGDYMANLEDYDSGAGEQLELDAFAHKTFIN